MEFGQAPMIFKLLSDSGGRQTYACTKQGYQQRHPFPSQGTTFFRKYMQRNPVAHGSALVDVNHDLPAKQIPLQTRLQARAARIYFNRRQITLRSTYLPRGGAGGRVDRTIVLVLSSGGNTASLPANNAWRCGATTTRKG